MYEVFILQSAIEYQKKVTELQKSGWTINFIQTVPENGKITWVVTAQRLPMAPQSQVEH